ncbi:MAG: LysM peptidoglycan-binding domain-containing protein [Lachnospiraceae bacterium]|nr:LysM peptidoglycan-binding domain-containing protein [Lachnospiraceae bacterium]
MIEVVYDRAKQTEDNVFEGIVLPKNIRQIGAPAGNKRIYIEDYVMTYLKQLANPNATYARGAILVGESVKGERGEALFISGALPAQNLELDLEESTFDGETWSLIYQEVKTHFPDLEVVGWFLSRMGFSTMVNDMIVRLHMDNFAGEDKVLYIMDALEDEEAFYMTEGDYLRRQSGYYIYYARNEAMQNFMIETKESVGGGEPSEVERKDEAVIRNYKKIMEERARHAKIERMNKVLYGMCSGLSVAVLALGIAVFSNYQMLEKMETKLVACGVLLTDQDNYGEYEVKVKKTNDKNPQVTNIEEKTATVTTNKVNVSSTNLPNYYTVQNGDTLSSISFKMYNSVGYVAELMEANGFGEADEIREGDCIIIPTVK